MTFAYAYTLIHSTIPFNVCVCMCILQST